MGTNLSSWKEIAQYVGKGVRTVQRWEREAGLPVRRPHGEGKGKVLAFPEEIDGWIRSAFSRNGNIEDSELSTLRTRINQLVAENQELRRSLNAAFNTFPIQSNESGYSDESLLMRCSRALDESARTRQKFAQLIATYSAVSQSCADSMQLLKQVEVFQHPDLLAHDAD